MADYNLGTARGVVEIQYKGDGVKQAQTGMKGLNDSAISTEQALNKSATAAGLVGAVIAGGLTVAIGAALGFEKSLSNVQSVTGATAGEMENLSDKALQIGKDTAFSSAEAADAMFELAKAGISTTDILDGAADSTIALAAAGEIDLANAATIMSAAMNSFNIEASDSGRVADLLAGTANSTATDVTSLGEALKNVGPIASATGVSIEDTTTALGLLAQQGISGGRAGTALAATLRQLNPQSETARKGLEALGLITEDGTNKFFDANGEMKSLAEVSQLLQDSTSDLTAEQKQLALTTIFGQEGFAGANALAAAGATEFTALGEAIGSVSAADVAATKLDNLSGQLTILKGSIETAAIIFGQALLPALTNIVQSLTGVVNAFANLGPGTQQAILAVLAITAGLLIAFAVFVKVALAIKSAIVVVNALAIGVRALNLAFLANPIGLIIIAVLALVAAIIYLYQNNEQFRAFVLTAWAAIQAAFSAVVSYVVGTLVPMFQVAFANILTAVQTFLSWVTGTAVPFLQAAWASVMAGVAAVVAFFVSAWAGIQNVVQVVFAAIVNIISTYINMWVTIIKTVLGALSSFWSAFWGTFGGVITGAFKLMVAIVKLNIAIVQLVIRTVFSAILALITKIWSSISSATKKAWEAVKSAVTAAVNAVKSVVTSVLNAISGFVTPWLNRILSGWTTIWNSIKSVVTSVLNAIIGFISPWLSRVLSGWTTIWNSVKSVTSSALNAVKSTVSSVLNSVISVVTSILARVTAAFTSAWNTAKSLTIAAFNSIKSSVGESINSLVDKVRSIKDRIKGALSGASTFLLSAGRDIIRGLINGVESMLGSLTSKLNGITRLIPKLKGPPKKDKILLEKNGELIMRGLIVGIESMVSPLSKVLGSIGSGIPGSVGTSQVRASAVLPSAAANAQAGSIADAELAGVLESLLSEVTDLHRDVKRMPRDTQRLRRMAGV